MTFLAARTGQADAAGAAELAAELGCLPLALAQAAAVIAAQHLPYATYLERLRRLPVSDLLVGGGGRGLPGRGAGRGAAVPAGGPGRGPRRGLRGGDGPGRGAVPVRDRAGPGARGRRGGAARAGRAAARDDGGGGGCGAGPAGRGVAADLQRGRDGGDRAPAGDAGDPGQPGRRRRPGRRVRGGRGAAGRPGRRAVGAAACGPGRGPGPGRAAAGAGRVRRRLPARHRPGYRDAPGPLVGAGVPDRARRQHGAGHHGRRAAGRRPRARPGPRPPRHPDLAQQPRRRLPGRRAAPPRRSPCTSRPWPPASASWAPTTPTP